MEILHVNTKARLLDRFKQPEIYEHTRAYGNNFLNEQSQFKSLTLLTTLHNAHTTSICRAFQTMAPSPKTKLTALLAAISDEAHNERKLAQAMR